MLNCVVAQTFPKHSFSIFYSTGEASTDPDRPNFVPTLFPSPKKRQAASRNKQW